MNHPAINLLITLLAFIAFPTVLLEDPPEPPLPEDCQQAPLEPKPPNFKGLNLNEILANGILDINNQIRKTSQRPIEATFVFGKVGSGKSIVAPLLFGNDDALDIGQSKDNVPVLFRDDINNQLTNTRKSSTLVPQYFEIYSNDSGLTAYWDCPGLGFNNGSNADVAQTYFLKHALEITKSAKFIFTTSHASLLLQEDFRNLANYVVTLIKDVSKFTSSIGLIVTEIEKSSDLTDEEILSSVQDSLKEFITSERNAIEELHGKRDASNDIYMLSQRIAFTEGLLEEVEEWGNYNRLYFIRSPDTCESLSKILEVWNTIAILKILQFSILQHSQISPEEFGFPLRAATFQKIERVLQEIDLQEEDKYASETATYITALLRKTINVNNSIVHKVALVNSAQNSFERYFGKLLDKGRVIEPPTVGVLSPENSAIEFYMICASQRLRTIQFLQDVTAEVYGGADFEVWGIPFQILESGLYNLTEFYQFCNETNNVMGEYSTQIVILQKIYNNWVWWQVDTDNVPMFIQEAGISIPHHIYKTYIEDPNWSSIWYHLSDNEKQILVSIVQQHWLPPTPNFKCDHQATSSAKCLRGDYSGRIVYLSRVITRISESERSPCCTSSVDSKDRMEISVVATETLYLDSTFYNDKALHISIIAPVWVVESVGQQSDRNETLGLYVNGPNIYPSEDLSVAAGGGFFGVYSDIINSSRLFIQAKGGSTFSITNPQIGPAGTINLVSTGEYINISTNADGKPPLVNYKPLHGIFEYLAAFVNNLFSNCNAPKYADFFWHFRLNSDYASFFTPLFFAKELESLEKSYSNRKENSDDPECSSKMKIKLANFYEEILQVISENLEYSNEENKLAFTLIGSLVVSRLISQRRLDKTLNVINTENYLSALERDLEIIEKLEIRTAIIRETQEYKNSLDEKIKEAQQLISETVSPALNEAEKALKEVNLLLLDAMREFLEAEKANLEAAKKMKAQLKNTRALKGLWGGLRTMGTVCSFFGPIGATAGGILQGIASVGDAFTGDTPDPKNLPKSFSQYTPDESDAYYLRKLKDAPRRLIHKHQDNNLRVLNSEQDDKRDAETMRQATLYRDLGDNVGSMIKQFREDSEKMDEVNKAITDAEKGIKKIEGQIDLFDKKFSPAFDDMSRQVLEESKNLDGTSKAGLTVKKWEMKNMLKDMMEQVEGFAGWVLEAQQKTKKPGERSLYEKFKASFDTLGEALVVLVEMYGHIENYQERKELAQFISNVNAPSTGIDELIKDEELKRLLKKFELSIRINLLLEEYKKAEHAFKQFVFPFARDYLTKKNEPFSIKPNSNLTLVVDSTKRQIVNLRSIIQKYNAITTVHDQFVFFENFTSGSRSTRPFFAWRHEQWNATIHELLQGNTIQLKSDCNMSGHENEEFFANKAAIKFKEIHIFIRTHDKNRQNELTDVLQNFRMSMTHSGISIYQVNQEQFVMRDARQTFSYNFETHMSQNAIRYKVSGPNSDFLMSPYTWWTLKMENIFGSDFEVLKAFASDVDLVLEGHGSYLNEKDAGPEFLDELQVSEYYESYEPSSFRPTWESPLHCNRAQMSNLQLDTMSEVDESSIEEGRGLVDSIYDDFAQDFNAHGWKDTFSDFQERPKTYQSQWYEKRPDRTHELVETYGDEEPLAAAMPPYEERSNHEIEPRAMPETREDQEENHDDDYAEELRPSKNSKPTLIRSD